MVINEWSVLKMKVRAAVNESQSIEKARFSQRREKWGTLCFVIEKPATRLAGRPILWATIRTAAPPFAVFEGWVT
jgi:hypothetical protein